MDLSALIPLPVWPRLTRGRPVLAATAGPGLRPPAKVAAAILAVLGEGAIGLVLSPQPTDAHGCATQRKLDEQLSHGRSVLVHPGTRDTAACALLLDTSARHAAWSVALVRGTDDDCAAVFVTQLAAEGWNAAAMLG